MQVDSTIDSSSEYERSFFDRLFDPIPNRLSASIEHESTIEKTCEKCDGSGELRYMRDATMNDLTDMQIKLLTEADIYRESGGQTEEDVNSGHSGPGGPTPSEAKARARANAHGGSMPNAPNSF